MMAKKAPQARPTRLRAPSDEEVDRVALQVAQGPERPGGRLPERVAAQAPERPEGRLVSDDRRLVLRKGYKRADGTRTGGGWLRKMSVYLPPRHAERLEWVSLTTRLTMSEILDCALVMAGGPDVVAAEMLKSSRAATPSDPTPAPKTKPATKKASRKKSLV